MKYGLINRNLVDLWAKPEYNCERLNQAFYLEPIRIISKRKGYLKLTISDGYSGWVKEAFVTIITPAQYRAVQANSGYFVNQKVARLVDKDKKAVEPYLLYYGTKLMATKADNGYYRIKAPTGESLLIRSSALSKIKDNKDLSQYPNEAKRFLGTPYLWGGVSSLGFDCSGLVQTILKKYGIKFPRDTKDQIKKGKKITRKNIKRGDLLFFKRHIAIALSKTSYIHSSVGNNGIFINSLNPNDDNYHKQLDVDFQQARRII